MIQLNKAESIKANAFLDKILSNMDYKGGVQALKRI